jgi:hypothetical protein
MTEDRISGEQAFDVIQGSDEFVNVDGSPSLFLQSISQHLYALCILGDPAAIKASESQKAAKVNEAITGALRDLVHVDSGGGHAFASDLKTKVGKDLGEEIALAYRQR